MTIQVRPPAVAGQFYPAEAETLQKMVRGFLQTAVSPTPPPFPKAIIAPHAGYIYSGPIAGTAYTHWLPAKHTIQRVILIGPSHYVAVKSLALSSTQAFRTPLGDVPVDQQACAAIAHLPQVRVSDEAHAPEHSLEVHLPFLQTVFANFQIVPLVVGSAETAEIAQLLNLLWGGPETVIVVSSDLSHFYNSQTARHLDSQTAHKIETLHPLNEGDACGRIPINGLLHIARQHHLQAQAIDLRNSADTAGRPNRVVGYGAFVFRSLPEE